MSDIHVFIVENESDKNEILKMNGWTLAQIFDASDREEIVKALDSIQEKNA